MRVSLPRQTSSVYSLLNQISRQTGYFFIYDSQLIDNNRRVSMRKTRQEVHVLLSEILRDPGLHYRIIENHILIYRPAQEAEPIQALEGKTPEAPVYPGYFTVRGRLIDQLTNVPLPYAAVGIPDKGLGISTNNDGYFQLRLARSLLDENLRISYLGYKSQSIPLRLLVGNQVDILMETDYISMQEVIIRYFDPKLILQEALQKKSMNYSAQPVYMLSFYREGVQRNQKFLNYSEAIFRVYKTPYNIPQEEDQVMLLKARNIVNINRSDTLVMKLKAGVQSSLDLDIIKQVPDFLDETFMNSYDFFSADLVTRNGRSVYAIEFRQKERIREPLYQGTLFIDTESMALIEADFELNPRYIRRAQDRFLVHASPYYAASLEKASYSIRYQYFKGHYHLSHVRGEIKLKIRRKKQLFSNNYMAFLEMAVCHIDDKEVQRFTRNQTMQTRTALIDQGYQYDDSFWGEYNIIAPESNISEALSKMQSRIENFFTD